MVGGRRGRGVQIGAMWGAEFNCLINEEQGGTGASGELNLTQTFINSQFDTFMFSPLIFFYYYNIYIHICDTQHLTPNL